MWTCRLLWFACPGMGRWWHDWRIWNLPVASILETALGKSPACMEICALDCCCAVTAQGPDIPTDFGVIAVRATANQTASGEDEAFVISIEFAAVHSARSMAFAFFDSAKQPTPTACILRQRTADCKEAKLAVAAYQTAWTMHA